MIRTITIAALAALAFAVCVGCNSRASAPAANATAANAAATNAPVALGPLSPTDPPATLRAQFGAIMVAPSRKMPADAAKLDAMLTAGQYAALYARLTQPLPPDQILLDINWEAARIFNGASVLVTYTMINDQLRNLPSAPPEKQAAAMQTALVYGLYAQAELETESLGCGSTIVIGRREQELDAMFAPMWATGRAMPADMRSNLVSTALELEAATRSVRGDDVVACDWGPTKKVDPGPTAGIGADLPADGADYPFGAHDTMGNESLDPYAHLRSDLVGQITPAQVGPQ